MSIQNKLYKVANLESQYALRPNLFIWPHQTLFIGPLLELGVHSMGGLAINVGIYHPFLLNIVNGSSSPYRCVIIPAGCKHEISAHGNIVVSLVIERNSPAYAAFRKRYKFHETEVTEIEDSEWVKCFQKIYEEKPPKKEVEKMLNKLLGVDDDSKNNLDPRINNAIKLIQLDPESILSQDDIACDVGLSTSRFRHLFQEQLDIPFRRYRMWQRVISAMTTLHKVDNLTYAAMEAGFTDSSHFNRCFQSSFGVNPSLVFKQLDRFEVSQLSR